MNNSLYELIVRGEPMFLSLIHEADYHVTGTLSCLREEVEDFGKYSNPGWYYTIWKDDTDELVFKSNSYADLLQYLQKEDCLWKESNQT